MSYLRPRRASAWDLPALRRLQTASVRGLAARHYTPDQIEAFLAHATPLEALLRHGQVWAVACGIEVVASAAVHPDGAVGSLGLEATHDPQTAVVRAVHVDPRWAGRGLAGRLMAQVEAAAAAAGARRATLHAMRGSEGFYARLGYEPGDAVTFDLDGVPFPGLSMSKPVSTSHLGDGLERWG